MGRSRLAYRAKHKGILSENSRKQIQEAKRLKQKNQEEVIPEAPESDNMKENEKYIDIEEEEIEEGHVDLFTEPKLYYLEREYDEFANSIYMDERLHSPLLFVMGSCWYLV